MKRNRFTDEQIIGTLKEHGAGTPVADFTASTRQRCQHLKVESEVRRYGRVWGQAAEDAGGREHEAEAASGGCHDRQCCLERSCTAN